MEEVLCEEAITKEEGSDSRKHDNTLFRIVSGIDQADATDRYNIEEADNRIPSLPHTESSSVTSERRKIISWDDCDPENPYNWPSGRKAFIVLIGMIVVINSTMGSSLPSNAIPAISTHFNITNSYVKILPISMYLVGYVCGPCLFGPLSESYGRKHIMTSTFFFFMIFTMGCALAPNLPALLVFRFLTGVSASSPIAIIGGIYADIYNDPVTRGRAMATFMGGTCIGPLVAPFISGFVAPTIGWRFVFWIGLILAGFSAIFLLQLPETYGPILLAKRARHLRMTTGNTNIFAAIELENKGWKEMVTRTLTRPIRMLCFEYIVLASSLYLALAYGIFYMFFESWPLVFQGIYGQSLGVSGLMFLPIGIGAFLAVAIFLWYDSFLRNAQKQNKPWAQIEEYRRLPLACIGGPSYVIALFWLGWTSKEGIPFWVPMLAGIPFGMGFVLIFMALLNFLTDAYEIFAASAMAASSMTRSLAGAVLPFAAPSLYGNLGISWASSLLGFLSLCMCGIPFFFLWKGQWIRDNSVFCIHLKKMKEKEEAAIARERRARYLALAETERVEGVENRVAEKV